MWKFTPSTTGTYRIDHWNIVNGNSDPAGSATVTPAQTGSTTINGQIGTIGWVALETDELTAGPHRR